MRTETIFSINGVDYSDHVIAGSYSINNSPVFKEYDDANGNTHRVKIRDRIEGSFSMWFRTVEEFNDFMSDVNSATTPSNNISVAFLLVNNTNQSGNFNVFLDYDTTRNRDGSWNDYMERFTVKVKER